jgi:hypothetical protein
MMSTNNKSKRKPGHKSLNYAGRDKRLEVADWEKTITQAVHGQQRPEANSENKDEILDANLCDYYLSHNPQTCNFYEFQLRQQAITTTRARNSKYAVPPRRTPCNPTADEEERFNQLREKALTQINHARQARQNRGQEARRPPGSEAGGLDPPGLDQLGRHRVRTPKAAGTKTRPQRRIAKATRQNRQDGLQLPVGPRPGTPDVFLPDIRSRRRLREPHQTSLQERHTTRRQQQPQGP